VTILVDRSRVDTAVRKFGVAAVMSQETITVAWSGGAKEVSRVRSAGSR
jgi:hypothetical protein